MASPPKIVLPIGACSTYLRLQGQFPGATVKIHASKDDIFDTVFSGTASFPDEVFELTRQLGPGEHVIATQAEPGTDPPNWRPRSEDVQPLPTSAELKAVKPATHAFVCGHCIAFSNTYPGGVVSLSSTTDGLLGEAPAVGHFARIYLSAPFSHLQSNEQLRAMQTVCGQPGPITVLTPPDDPAMVPVRKLAAPIVKGPLHACQCAVRLEGVIPGA
ncbi:MAG TPA: hypothetical protein VH394_02290, partial [Thermoanaerobaculia bacterium]|nr:hypothetical protein [Thermoanaerobaculia bacterium]